MNFASEVLFCFFLQPKFGLLLIVLGPTDLFFGFMIRFQKYLYRFIKTVNLCFGSRAISCCFQFGPSFGISCCIWYLYGFLVLGKVQKHFLDLWLFEATICGGVRFKIFIRTYLCTLSSFVLEVYLFVYNRPNLRPLLLFRPFGAIFWFFGAIFQVWVRLKNILTSTDDFQFFNCIFSEFSTI